MKALSHLVALTGLPSGNLTIASDSSYSEGPPRIAVGGTTQWLANPSYNGCNASSRTARARHDPNILPILLRAEGALYCYTVL